MEKISYRTQVLFKILEFQKEHDRGILFNELIELLDIERATISKCYDSLWDMGLIEDKMELIGESWSKVIFIPEAKMKFVQKAYDDMMKGS